MSNVTTAKPVSKLASLRALIEGDLMKQQLARALPKVLPADRFVRTLITTLNKMPELAECDQQSVLAGVVTAAQLGLEIDPTLGRAYLIPFKDRQKGMVATFIIGYRGFVELAYRSGQIASFQAEVVYANDEFEYELGLDPKLRHVPTTSEDRGPLRYAYAVVKLKAGGSVFRVLGPADIAKAKASSRSVSSSYSPWTTHPDEMWRKTAIRAIAKMLPLSPELREATSADTDDDRDTGKAFARATEVPAQVVEEPAAGAEQPAVHDAEVVHEPAPAANGPDLRITYNTLFAKARQAGVEDAQLAKVELKGPAEVAQLRKACDQLCILMGEPPMFGS